jgi:hypothetical protein
MHALAADPVVTEDADRFELRFRSLFDSGRALVFSCDAQGRIDLDRLSENARERYLYARALVGRDFATPEVMRV